MGIKTMNSECIVPTKHKRQLEIGVCTFVYQWR